MVAVQRQQDRRARGQPDHAAHVPLDLDQVVRPERLAQAQHDRGHEVLDRVADRETDRQTHDPGRAKDGPEQSRRAQKIQRNHDTDDGAGDAEGLAVDTRDEGIRRDPVPEPQARQQDAEGDDHRERARGKDEQGQAGDELFEACAEAFHGRVELLGYVVRRGKRVVDRHDTFETLGDCRDLPADDRVRDIARQPDHTGLHRHGDPLVFERAQNGAQPFGNGLIRGPVLDRENARRIGWRVTLLRGGRCPRDDEKTEQIDDEALHDIILSEEHGVHPSKAVNDRQRPVYAIVRPLLRRCKSATGTGCRTQRSPCLNIAAERAHDPRGHQLQTYRHKWLLPAGKVRTTPRQLTRIAPHAPDSGRNQRAMRPFTMESRFRRAPALTHRSFHEDDPHREREIP